MGNDNDNQGVKERIKARLLEATDEESLRLIRQELKDQGAKPGSIDACVSELRKQGHLKFSASSGRGGTLATRKTGESILPEWLSRDVAEIFDGEVRDQRIFMAGMSVPLMGLRLFGEAIKPLVELMGVWGRGQAEAAKAQQGSVLEAAQVAGQAAAGGVAKYFMEEKPWLATAQNPMQAMMADALGPLFKQLLGQVTGTLIRPAPQPGQKPGGNAPGVAEMSNAEEKEIFG